MVNSLVYDSFPFIKCIDNAVVVGRMPLMTDDSEWIKIQNDHFILTLYYGNFQICTELDRLLCRATYLPPTFTFTYQSCLHSSVLVLSVIKTPFFGEEGIAEIFYGNFIHKTKYVCLIEKDPLFKNESSSHVL